MPRLEKLWFEDCKLLMEIPSGVEHLSNLRTLGLVDMAEELTKTMYRESEDENFLRVEHIPSIFIGRRTDVDSLNGHYL